MPTEREKQAEKQRVTRISGFRVAYHDFLAEVDLDALKKRNDRWEADHRGQSLLDRKIEELTRIAAYVAMKNPAHHIQIHVHAAHEAGATPEEIYKVIDDAGGWAGGAARQNGMEAWRLVFRPDLPTINAVVELTSDSFER
jgi:alkylhydroperoxidase/carboxymuconolactone decarboxylase family protein YurZ